MSPTSDPRRRRLVAALSWTVVGVVMVSLAGVAVHRVFLDHSDEPENVDDVRSVAERAETIAEDLDVLGGVELLCETPMDLYRMAVESTIVGWQDRTGSDLPKVTAETSDVDTGTSGSFVITISGAEDGIEEVVETFRVFVERHDGRSCVTGVGGPDATRQTTRFSGGGYSRATSPAPSPTPTPTPTPAP